MSKRDRGNGTGAIPKAVERDDSERLVRDILSHVQDVGAMPDLTNSAADAEPRVTGEQLLAQLVHRNGKPPSRLKQWGTNTIGGAVLALLAGFGTYKAYQAKTDNNEKSIEIIDKKVGAIDKKVGAIETELKGVQHGQAAIVEGLDSLKQDKLNALERERDKLERELARERRRNR